MLAHDFLASAVLLQVGAQLLVPLAGWRAPFLISAAGLALAAPAVALIMLPDAPRPRTGGSVLASYRVLPGLSEAISAGAGPARGSALALFSFALAAGSGIGPQMAAAFPAFTPLVYGVAATMTVAAVAVVISARRAVPLSSSPRPRSHRG
ncbi:hypothetical protein [Nonomuraea typhae]|uniref:MFS transporter n=1 Tax=Nonomuraea typhae TaxID=2603600 RepID=A0ABW7Z2Q3_9ACTN